MTFPAQLISFINTAQNQQNYPDPGIYEFIVPNGVTVISAVATGGGGGGAGNNATTTVGTGGGGGGGTAWGVFTVQPGDKLQIVVGSGGTGGTTTGNGQNGGNSYVGLATRGGVTKNQIIIQGNGGSGGTRAVTTGIGGNGGTWSANTSPDGSYELLLSNGGNGGNGASSETGGGGGGAGGYRGNGGNGGSITPAIDPTAAAANSGGGGGGGGTTAGSASDVAYGGGGTGSYGYSGFGQGSAGQNDTSGIGSGGKGNSFFLDPGFAINAAFVGQSVSTTTEISYPLNIVENDFLLLLSGSDAFTGSGANATNFTSIPVPTGFTTISQTVNGLYTVNSTLGITSIIPQNVDPPSRDLNFTTSYRYVPESGLTGNLTGLTTSSIHNMIALRYIPNPASIIWATDSADPASNTGAGNYKLMPDPPGIVSGISSGSIAIALGFLSNTILNPGNDTAGANTTLINSVSGGKGGESGQGVGLVASYMSATSTGTYNPEPFLTGTTAHSRSYTIQVNTTSGSVPTVVGSAVTGTWFNSSGTPQSPTTLNLPSTPQNNDLIVVITSWDSPNTPNTPSLTGTTFTVPTGADVANGNGQDFAGDSNDNRGGGGLGFKISYATWNTGDGTQLTGLTGGSEGTPASHMVIILRNASLSYSNPPRHAIFDNGSSATYGPPDPPALATNSADSLVLAIGMIDNIAISNVTGVGITGGYTMLATQSYGAQNNGAIIMSAYKQDLAEDAPEDPPAFIGGGGNIWASQTLIIGGQSVTSQTNGTNNAPGRYGGGGGARADDSSGIGMAGAQGGVRLIWGNARQYPSTNQGNAPELDWTIV
jgi:hypothetical protein